MRNIWNEIKGKYCVCQPGLIPGFTILAIIILCRIVGSLQPLEWFGLDVFLRFRPPESPDPRIVIVGINEQDLSQIGSYPISDLEIAQLLTTIVKHQPRVIGLDLNRNLPIEPGNQELKKILQTNTNIIVIEKVLPTEISPPPYLPAEQLGFSDAILDGDGSLRRVLLGTPVKEEYKFSLSLRLAKIYLAAEGITLENGIIDEQAMRFNHLEIPRFLSNSGGYIQAEAGGVQMLLNFRSGQKPFVILSLEDIKNNNFSENFLKDKIVIIGMMTPTLDKVHSSAILKSAQSELIHGVEIHAYSASQIISAVKDNRPLLYTMSEIEEYFFIVVAGFCAILLSRLTLHPWANLVTLTVFSGVLIGLSYLFLWQFGLWIPIVPVILVLVLNGTLLTAFYQYDLHLRGEIEQRQLTINNTFDAIHNGPLQSLAQLLRTARESEIPKDELVASLENLNKEIRTIYELILENNQENKQRLNICGQEIDLNTPLCELFYEVYFNTLNRDFPYFKTLKVKIRNFESIEPQKLKAEQKRGLCRFLEEALCNVGKYATNATRLNVVYMQEEKWYVIRITDNGEKTNKNDQKIEKNGDGRGTKQAKSLARELRGEFKRSPLPKKGTVCELKWPIEKVFLQKRK